MKLITFMGTGPRYNTLYQWGDKRSETAHFSIALIEWLKPSEVLVMLTPEAKAHDNWQWLQAWGQEHHVSILPIDIPIGATEDEQWQIFEAMTEKLEQSDRVIFDITHGFRSLPVLALLAALYLRVVKDISLEYMLYGAYEARDQSVTPNVAPVIDMTGFLNLLDWVSGAEELIYSGLSGRIAKLLSDKHKHLYTSKTGRPLFLSKTGGHLQAISSALQLAQPQMLAKTSERLADSLSGAEQEAHWVKPFKTLIDKISEYYAPFSSQDLITQRQLVCHFKERQQWVQAITLTREWLVSYLCLHVLDTYNPERVWREQVERAWTGYLKKEQKFRDDVKEKSIQVDVSDFNAVKNHPKFLKVLELQDYMILNKVPNIPELAKIWYRTTEVRNQIAHCGMGRDEGGSGDSLIKQIENIITEVVTINIPEVQA